MNRPHLVSRLAGLIVTGGLLAALPARADVGQAMSLAHTEVALTPAGQTLRFYAHDGVREYVNEGGKVFAVTWKAPAPPNVESLLGTYAGEYRAALQQPHTSGHHFVVVKTPNVTVTKTVYARVSTGSILLHPQMPKGVTINDLP